MDDNFFPCFVWPNPAIPFRLYYASEKCRIFIIENVQHNYKWLKQYRRGIKPTDHFFVIVGCHYHDALVYEAARSIRALDLDMRQFHILYNDATDRSTFEKHGFSGEIVNHNAFLDEDAVMRPLDVEKRFDAIYVARFAKFKRHELSAKVANLALVAGNVHGAAECDIIPEHVYKNAAPLSELEVAVKINESRCGLILSAAEGACFSSSEYLLCGVPVVSTPSEGGRSVWYTAENSRIVDPTPEAVAAGVDYFKKNRPNASAIRRSHSALAEMFRLNFATLLGHVVESSGDTMHDPVAYFKEHFFHKMRSSVRPDFEQLFAGT